MKLSGTNRLGSVGLAFCAAFSLLPAAGEVAPLESLPEVNRIWMGLEEGSIRPAAYEQVRATLEGYLSLRAEDGDLIEKDGLWAVIDPENLEIERESLALEEDKLKRQLEKSAEDSREAELRLALDIHEAEGKRQTLVDASGDPEIPADLRKRAADAILKIDERLGLLRDKADPETLKSDLALEETEGRLLISRKRKQLLSLEKRSRLVAGFDGELRLSDSLNKAVADREEPDSLLWVTANEHLATLVDDNKYEIVVAASGPVLSQIPSEEILVFLQEPKTGALIAGDYDRTDEIDTGGEITRNYVFTIRENSLGDARHSSGQRGLVHVYRKFDSPVRLVHKKDIAFAASDILATSGWGGVVNSLWPGSRIVQVAPQTIAVMPKDDN